MEPDVSFSSRVLSTTQYLRIITTESFVNDRTSSRHSVPRDRK